MTVDVQPPRSQIVCWCSAATLLIVTSLYLLITEGVEGPWPLALLLSFPMFAAAAQRLPKPIVLTVERSVLIVFCSVGAWQGYASTQTFPYIATYIFLSVWILAIVLCGIGGIASLSKLSRRPAKVFCASGLGLLLMFYLSLGITQWAGLNRWEELQRPIPIDQLPR